MKDEAKKKQRPVCPRCRHSGFLRSKAPDGRPQFTCNRCEYFWTSGLSGGEWFGFEMNKDGPIPEYQFEKGWESLVHELRKLHGKIRKARR